MAATCCQQRDRGLGQRQLQLGSDLTPSTAGTYRWRASYSGDAKNAAVAGACNDPNESSLVGEAIVPPVVIPPVTTPTGQRAAALKKCKKKRGRARRNCKKRANKLPL